MTEPRPMLRVMMAIAAHDVASSVDPNAFDPRGPTARRLDRFLGLPEGKARQLIQSMKDRDFIRAAPPGRGNAQRMSLTDSGRVYLRNQLLLARGR